MDKGPFSDYVTLKLWFGGSFTRNETGLVYNGRLFRTSSVEIDEFCWFTLIEEAGKCGCGFNSDSDGLFFMNPGVGLQRIVDDIGSQVMCKIGAEKRVVEGYLVSCVNIPPLMQLVEEAEISAHTITKCPKKLTPKRKEESISKSAREGPPAKANIEIDSHTEKRKEPTQTASHIKEKRKIITQTPSHTSIKRKGKTTTQTSTETLKKCSPKKPHTSNQTTSNIETTSSIPDVDVELPHVQQNFGFYDFNDVTISDVFSSYEEDADLACLNINAELESEDISEERDPGYEPDFVECETDYEGSDTSGGSEVEVADRGEENFTEAQYESDGYSEDDECKEARKKVKEWNRKALEIAKQLELKAASILLPGQETGVNGESSGLKDGEGNVSEYDNSDDELDTPGESDEESVRGKRKKSSIPVVNERTDFSKLKWCVGIRFATREIFRDCVTRYAIAQGRNLTFDISDKKRGKRLGVKCKAGCPFKLYGSWDNTNACIFVKSVTPTHNCRRTMESNRQLKSSWLAKQFLDVFKARPSMALR